VPAWPPLPPSAFAPVSELHAEENDNEAISSNGTSSAAEPPHARKNDRLAIRYDSNPNLPGRTRRF
jgi:hypothetical protein